MDARHHSTEVIAIANPRQGVGKSVVALNLAASLAIAEQRVLLVVLDPRSTVAVHSTPAIGIYEVLREGSALGAAIVPAPLQQLEVVLATPSLWQLDIELLQVRGRELRLRQALATATDLYDFVLIDCPSAAGLLTISALCAATRVIVPVAAATSICVEAEQLLQVVASVRRNLNPTLGGLHMVVNKAVVNRSTKQTDAEPRHLLPQIPVNTDIAAAAVLGMPAVLQAADSSGALVFRQLAATLLTTLAATPRSRAWEYGLR